MKPPLKMTLLASLLTAVFTTASFAQTPPKVTLNLKNNGWQPREFRFLERHPADKFLNVFTAYLLPGQSYRAELKVGTTLAQVTQPEINAAMRGQSLPGTPLLTVQAADDGRTVALINK